MPRFSPFQRRRKATPSASESVNGAASPLEVKELDKPFPPAKPVSFGALFRFATKTELCLDGVGLVAAAGAGAAQPLMALFLGNLANTFINFGVAVINAGKNPSNPDVIAAASDFRKQSSKDAAILAYIGIGMFVATYIYMVIWVRNGEVMAKRARERYLEAILRQDIAFFDNVGPGEVATRIQSDTHSLQQGTSEKVALVVNYLGSFLCGYIIAYVRSWRLALAITAVLPCIIITGGLMNKVVSSYSQLSRQSVADGGTLAEEVISSIRTIHAFGIQAKLQPLYDRHIAKAFLADRTSGVWYGTAIGIYVFIIYAAYALAFSFGTTLILRHEATPGQIINVALAMLVGSFSLASMAPELQALAQARGAAAKLWETIDRVPPIDSASPNGLSLSAINGHVDFEGVVFEYPSRPGVTVLKGVTLSFEAGKTTAVVGPSGSGKSTVISLIERFYDPLSGNIKLDGNNIRSLNLKWLRRQIGLVSQEPVLFAATILQNVAHGLTGTAYEDSPPEEKFQLVKTACIRANADDFISKLPKGYDTMVGERGFLLSGGQKQRIAIARAIVADPKILLLDEATSALDTQSEEVVQNALDKASTGRTTIVIAHRLSTIKDADLIYVMGDGSVLESGTHAQLLDEGGAYAKLVEAQKLKEGKTPYNNYGISGSLTSIAATEVESLSKDVESTKLETPKQQVFSESKGMPSEEPVSSSPTQKRGKSFDSLLRIVQFNRESWKLYIPGTICAIGAGMVYPAYGIIYGVSLQSFEIQDRHKLRFEMDRNALWFFIVAILAGIVGMVQNYLLSSAAAKLTENLRSLYFSVILRQDITFFDQEDNNTGALTSKLSDNPQKVNGLAGTTFGAIVQSLSCLVGGSIIGLAYGWKLALVGIACIPLVISTGYVRLRVVLLKDQTNRKAHHASAQLACEAVAAIKTVASLGREEACLKLYSESLMEPLKQITHSAFISNGLFALTQAISFFIIALIFWYGSRLVADLEYNTRQFFVCLMSVVFASIQAGNIFSWVPDISSAKGAADDMLVLFDRHPDERTNLGKVDVSADVQGHLTFQDVLFSYPTRKTAPVLRGINLDITPGTCVALVGASGCGKSTILQLLQRFYEPDRGTILLDGVPIADLDKRAYRKVVALVPQEPTLYSGSVKFNVLLGAVQESKTVDQSAIEAACKEANILEFINSLPEGFETQVGSKGARLSGGQKQRLAIARALIRNPRILLLDEATSALDSASEKVVQEAIDRAKQGRTTMVIAHRLSTIQNADKICFVKDGRISEIGTHEELLALRGDYHAYVQLQTLSHN